MSRLSGLDGSLVWDPAATPENQVADGNSYTTTTITVPGAKTGDYVFIAPSGSLNALTLTAYVSSANTVTVLLANSTGSSRNIPSLTFRVKVVSFESL